LGSGLSFVQSCTPIRRSAQSAAVAARLSWQFKAFLQSPCLPDRPSSAKKSASSRCCHLNNVNLLKKTRPSPACTSQCQHPTVRFSSLSTLEHNSLFPQTNSISLRQIPALSRQVRPAHVFSRPHEGLGNCARRNLLYLPGLFHPSTVLRVLLPSEVIHNLSRTPFGLPCPSFRSLFGDVAHAVLSACTPSPSFCAIYCQ